MPVEWFDALSEQRVFDRAEREMKNAERYKSGANPQIAERAGQIYRQSPWMTPSQVLALAKGGASDQAVQLASDIQAKVGTEKMDPNRPDDKNWFERNIYDKFKAGTRWSFAALDLVPDLAQNVASQVFSQNDPAGFDGWFASTKLGTMLSAKQGMVDPTTGQPVTAGQGFFIGESAEKLQSERARRVRGTINGSAWTIGRGAANVVFTPGSKGYSIASGLLDAVVLVGADPTVIGGKITAPIRGARALLQGVRSADEAAGLAKLAQAGVLSTLKNADRAAAGLSKAESLAVDGSKFIKFWTKDARAQRLVTYLANPENNDPVTLLRDVFKGKLDINTAKRFAAAKDENEVLGILAEVSRLMDEGNPRMLPTDIRDIPAALRKTYIAQRVPLWNSFRRSPLLTQVPEQVMVLGDDFDNTKAVLNAANYLDTLGTRSRTVGATVEEARAMTVKGRRLRFTETEEGKAIMGQIVDAYSSGDKSAVKMADEAFDTVVKTLLAKNGASDAEIADIFSKVKLTINDTRAYFINAAGEADDGGWFTQMLELDPSAAEQFKHLDPDQLKQLRMNGPGSVLELINRVHVLPDIREVRRVTANPLIRRAIKRGDETGQRAAVEYSEYLQNKIWKPITLATGGYIFRNMIDAQTRIALNGLDGFFNHPYKYIQWVLMKRGAADITGKNFDQVISSAVDDLGNAVSSNYDQALTFSLKKNLEDPVATAINAAKAKSFGSANKLTNRDEWFTGLVEELIQISKDGMMNAWAKGIPTDDLLEYYRSTETGRQFLDQFVQYLRNGVNIVDENGYSQGLYKVADPNDDVVKLWIDRLIGSRVELKTASDPDIKFATGYRRVPLGPLGDINAKDIRPQDIIDGPKNLGRGSLIRTVDDDGKEVFAIVSGVKTVTRPQSQIIAGFADETEDVILSLTRVSANDIIDSKEGRTEFAKFLRSKVESSEADATVKQFPKWTKVSQKAREQDNTPEALKLFDKFTDWFFQGVYGKASQKFERSPVFRQFYYDEVIRNVDYLSRESADELLNVIKQKAADFEMSPQQYVGGKANWNKLNKSIQKTKSGLKEQKVINTQLQKQPGALYHGSSIKVDGDFNNPFDIFQKDAENLMGRGIYLTDEPNVAFSYTAKGAKEKIKIDNIQGSESGFVYKTSLSPEAKVLDLRKRDERLVEAIRGTINEFGDEIEMSGDIGSGGDIGIILKALDNPDLTGEELMAAFKNSLKGSSMEVADEVQFNLSNKVLKFANVLSYQGGVRRGGLGKHNAFVVLDKKAITSVTELSPVVSETIQTGGTIDQLDDYAQMIALNKTKETLYNASTRNNLEDIMRIIVPFGVAYREVMGTYIKLMAQDPTRIRRGQLLYYGAENFDPDADGQGFFYKDPTSGEMSFNFPLSGELTKLLTGVNAPLQAPVKRVSIGLQVIPSLGPVGQIAASQLLPDTPAFDEVASILLPYGRDSFNPAPSWARKMFSAFKDEPGKLQSIYGNTYVDVVRALSASGDYDLDDEQSKANLLEDAKLKARVLTGLRGLAQFIGPAAPSLEYMVETEGGDVYASAMVQEFYRLQNENYDTAVSEFIRLFGEDAILYLSSKSKSVAGGLEATEAFGDWERSNDGLLTLYPDVAGYFAPGGDDFSFEVWDRQLRSGRRERLSAKEVIDNAQYKMGSALYRAYRQQVGAYPTEAQRAWLASARREISKRYPGFPATPVFTVGEFEKKIQDLRNAVQNESLADNAVAQAVATYLNYRDQAIAQYVAAGGQEGGFDSAKRAEPLRDYLVSIGQALVQRTPDFARIWDRELSNEVDK